MSKLLHPRPSALNRLNTRLNTRLIARLIDRLKSRLNTRPDTHPDLFCLRPTAIALGLALMGPLSHVKAEGQDYFGDLAPTPSYATVTGGLHIPSAELIDHGVFALQRDSFRNPRFAARATRSNNTGLTLRLFDYVELAGRLANYPAPGPSDPNSGFDPLVLRDLSANIKFQMPQLYDWLPTVAVGITDLGGAANFFDGKYGVATQAIGPVKVSLGYGLNSNQQFAGAFGGVEVRPLDWLNLTVLLEDDGRDRHAGVRYVSDEISWFNDARVVTTLSRPIGAVDEFGQSWSHTDASVVLQLPLYDRSLVSRLPQPAPKAERDNPRLPDTRFNNTYVAPDTPERIRQAQSVEKYGQGALAYGEYTGQTAEEIFKASKRAPQPDLQSPQALANLSDLQQALVDQGFTDVRLGVLTKNAQTLVVQFENHRYTRDEVDGFGVILGIVSSLAPVSFKEILAVSSKLGLHTSSLWVDRLQYQLFLAGEPERIVSDHLRFQALSEVVDEDIQWMTGQSASLKARVTGEPRQVLTAGTELANYDTSAGVNAGVYVPLWTGAEFFGSYTKKVYETNNFGRGKFFGDGLIEGWVNLSLQQSYQFLGMFHTATLGEFTRTAYGAQHESVKFFNDGQTLLQFKTSYTMPKRFKSRFGSFNSSSLALQHYHDRADVYSDITYHHYITEDKGFELGLTKFFGDVGTRLSIRDSEVVRFAGVTFDIPFAFGEAPRNWNGLQFNGSRVWQTGLFTRVGEETNFINLNGTALTRFRYRADSEFFNRYRVSNQHVQHNLGRMREAFYQYALPNLSKTDQKQQ